MMGGGGACAALVLDTRVGTLASPSAGTSCHIIAAKQIRMYNGNNRETNLTTMIDTDF